MLYRCKWLQGLRPFCFAAQQLRCRQCFARASLWYLGFAKQSIALLSLSYASEASPPLQLSSEASPLITLLCFDGFAISAAVFNCILQSGLRPEPRGFASVAICNAKLRLAYAPGASPLTHTRGFAFFRPGNLDSR